MNVSTTRLITDTSTSLTTLTPGNHQNAPRTDNDGGEDVHAHCTQNSKKGLCLLLLSNHRCLTLSAAVFGELSILASKRVEIRYGGGGLTKIQIFWGNLKSVSNGVIHLEN